MTARIWLAQVGESLARLSLWVTVIKGVFPVFARDVARTGGEQPLQVAAAYSVANALSVWLWLLILSWVAGTAYHQVRRLPGGLVTGLRIGGDLLLVALLWQLASPML